MVILAFALNAINVTEFVLANFVTGCGLGQIWFWSTKNKIQSVAIMVADICLPVFGTCALILFFFLSPVYRRLYKNKVFDVYDIPFGEELYDQYSEDKRIVLKRDKFEVRENRIHSALQIQPYLEIIEGERLELKINAIDKLSQQSTRESVSILKKALEQPEYEVRYFANNALEKIENRQLSKIEMVSENIKKNQSDKNLYNQRVWLYLETYFLGILDDYMKKYFLESALYDLFFSLQLDENQSILYPKMIQIQLFLKNYSEVLKLVDQSLSLSLSQEDKAKMQFYRAEANFFLGNLEDVSEDCRVAKERLSHFEWIRESAGWWSSVS
jgi:predicted DNA-binding protein